MNRTLFIAGVGASAVILIATLPWILGWAVGLLHRDETVFDHLLVLHEPETITRLELGDRSKNPVWVLENMNGDPLNLLDYGEVPAGFVQLEPKHGRPPELRRGEYYRLTFAMPGERYVSIWTRPARGGRFRHGLRVRGSGCDDPLCGDRFWYWRDRPWARQ